MQAMQRSYVLISWGKEYRHGVEDEQLSVEEAWQDDANRKESTDEQGDEGTSEEEKEMMVRNFLTVLMRMERTVMTKMMRTGRKILMWMDRTVMARKAGKDLMSVEGQ